MKSLENNMLKPEDKKEIENMIQIEVKNNFNKRIGDTPTDNLQLTPRKYVNMNGSVASRPSSVIATIGQSFFASDTNIPMIFSTTGWRNGIGSIVASA